MIKTYAVVGNAKSIFDKKDGKIIDLADVVIRFNGGIVIKPESQGTKTDILAYSGYRRKLKDFGKVEHWITTEFEERSYLQKMLDARPSNGLVILERLKNMNKGHHVRIFGFDWKETVTWYKERLFTKHDYKKEKEYCLELIKQLDWELY